MAGPHTARARARAQMLDDIQRVALEQLARDGFAGLSIRAVAREVGVVPSGLYRYFAGRDELVTALVVQAYHDLAVAVRSVTARTRGSRFRSRWIGGGRAVRRWATATPTRFQLLYGTPLPGYAAPPETVGPSVEVVLAVLTPLLDAVGDSPVRLEHVAPDPSPRLAGQLAAVAGGLDVTLAPGLLARAIAAWAETLGLVTLELGGHLVGGFEPADALVDAALADQADRLGLVD